VHEPLTGLAPHDLIDKILGMFVPATIFDAFVIRSRHEWRSKTEQLIFTKFGAADPRYVASTNLVTLIHLTKYIRTRLDPRTTTKSFVKPGAHILSEHERDSICG